MMIMLTIKQDMKYRSRTNIVSEILEAANGGASKSKIMYNAYLSYAQLKEYLSMMVEKDLIEYERGEHNFRTTDKGLKFLQTCQRLDSLAGSMMQRTV